MKKLFILLLAAFAFSLNAEEKEIVLMPGERQSIDLPAPPAGKQLRLKLTARIDSPKAGGGMLDALIITANNRRLGEGQLVDQSRKKIIYRGRTVPLFYKNGRMSVIYAPGFDTTAQAARITGKDIFTNEFDLGDLLKPGKPVKIIFTHPWSPAAAKRLKATLKVVLRYEFTQVKTSGSRLLEMETQIKPEEKKEWQFTRQNNERILLKLSARQASQRDMGGLSMPMEILVNGNVVRSRLDRQTRLLLDRPDFFTRHNGKRNYYESAGIWLAIWSNGYTTSPKPRYNLDAATPYTYTIDITPFVKNGENTLTVRNVISKGAVQQYKNPMLLCVVPEFVREPASKAKAIQYNLAQFSAQPALNIAADGAIELAGGKPGVIRLPGAFSQVGGGFNALGMKETASKLWKPGITRISDSKFTVKAATENYRLERTVELVNGRIKVADRLINTTGESVGIRYRQAVDFTNFDLPRCRMGGNPGHGLNHEPAAENPTLFIEGEKSSLGLVVEDDVARTHVRFYYDEQKKECGFYDDVFMLKPHAQYTVNWSIYCNPGNDYYDFINRVRRDWNTNYTIRGPVYFVGVNDIFNNSRESIAGNIAHKNIRYISFWEIRDRIPEANNQFVASCVDTLRSPVLAKMRQKHIDAAAEWRKKFPELKLSQYYHCFFNGFEQPGEQTWKDSWITNPDGSRLKSIYSYKDAWVYQSVLPYPGNKSWNMHLKNLDFLFDTMKIDWLYWDESNGPGVTAKNFIGSSPMTCNRSDGNTALIDPVKNTIMYECGMVPLLARHALQVGIDRVLKNPEGFVLFNGAPVTRARIRPGVYAMTETQDHVARSYAMHLTTPLAYGFGSPDFSVIVGRLNYGCLYVRTHVNYPSDAVSKFYPFTPEELHEGWVKGKERIITNRSGKFGWQGSFKARIWQYDSKGNRAEAVPEIKTYNNEVPVTVLPGGLSIIERCE